MVLQQPGVKVTKNRIEIIEEAAPVGGLFHFSSGTGPFPFNHKVNGPF
jgi:hypothetical protein